MASPEVGNRVAWFVAHRAGFSPRDAEIPQVFCRVEPVPERCLTRLSSFCPNRGHRWAFADRFDTGDAQLGLAASGGGTRPKRSNFSRHRSLGRH